MSVIIKSGASSNLLTIDGTSGAARTTLYDTAGNVLSTVTLGANTYQGSSVIQNIFTSTNNSSTANLGSGAAFTGTSDSLLGYSGIRIEFLATQQCTIQVQQSTNGTNWDVSDSYVVLANTGDARVFNAVGSSVRVIATNNGGISTTSLRLQTLLAPNSSNLPRSLTQLENFRMALVETTIGKVSYQATVNALTPPATPTDMVTITGSATRTVRIISWEISTIQNTAGINTYFLVKRSSANTGGTSAAVTAIPLDANDAAATATVRSYTANPTLGGTVGSIRATRLLSPAAATAQFGAWVWSFDTLNSKPVVLRGTAQVLALNFNGAALPAGLSVSCSINWTEEV